MKDAVRWQNPAKDGVSRFETLKKRHLIKRSVRDYLHGEGFIEIDMPLLVRGTTPDVEIESFAVDDRYLATSTEYQIKRMEIGGFDKSYTLTQNFRKGDTGRYRNPEFTMLEWARVGQTLHDIEADAEQMMIRAYKDMGGSDTLTYQGHKIDITAPWNRLSVREAVEKYTTAKLPDFTLESFRVAVAAAGIPVKDDWMNDQVFLFTVLLDHVQQFLGFDKPVFIQDWPKFLTSSALENASGQYVERSELFIAGVELSDGFPSLISHARQKETFAEQQTRRRHEGKQLVALDEKYLSAMEEGMPSGAGMALGFDRLVMVLTDRPDIASVLAYGWDEL